MIGFDSNHVKPGRPRWRFPRRENHPEVNHSTLQNLILDTRPIDNRSLLIGWKSFNVEIFWVRRLLVSNSLHDKIFFTLCSDSLLMEMLRRKCNKNVEGLWETFLDSLSLTCQSLQQGKWLQSTLVLYCDILCFIISLRPLWFYS